MADIFDRKEEVLDIVLTRKGRESMSMGTFKPVYYEFYDTDIIYDADNSELQNTSSERIKEGLYQKATVSLFSNISTPGGFNAGQGIVVPPPLLSPLPAMNLKNPLGTYAIGTQNAPAWSIKFNEGRYLTGNDAFSISEKNIVLTDINNTVISSGTLAGVETNEERIPQFYVNVKYKLYQLKQKIKGGGVLTNLYFDNNNEDLFLSIEEENVFSSGESPEFDIEIYAVDNNLGNPSNGTYELKQLYFDKEDFNDLDSIENYLNVLFDEEARFENNFKEKSIYGDLLAQDDEECD